MNTNLKTLIKDVLKRLDIGVARYRTLQTLIEKSKGADDILLLKSIPEEFVLSALKCLDASKGQLRQDIFALVENQFKQGGYFVEFGAASGVDLSNTYLLEKQFGWSGILAEPARCWHKSLRTHRTCQIETDCVWVDSHSTLTFNEAQSAELSTIETFAAGDLHSDDRQGGKSYQVKTISLVDLLDKYQAPKVIDYLSIDTEGSELDILSSFDFDRYNFKVITCEHNFTPARDKIFQLLTGKGYVRKFENLSQFDDWYVRA